MLGPLLTFIAGVIELVPGAVRAITAVARAARSSRPVAPISFGRDHLWDEVATFTDPGAAVTCVYCHTDRTLTNVRARCPGPPMPLRRVV